MGIAFRGAATLLVAGAFSMAATLVSAQEHDCAFNTSVGYFGIAADEGVSLDPLGAAAPVASINGWPMTVYYEPQQQQLLVTSVQVREGVTAGITIAPGTFQESQKGGAEWNLGQPGQPVLSFYCVRYPR